MIASNHFAANSAAALLLSCRTAAAFIVAPPTVTSNRGIQPINPTCCNPNPPPFSPPSSSFPIASSPSPLSATYLDTLEPDDHDYDGTNAPPAEPTYIERLQEYVSDALDRLSARDDDDDNDAFTESTPTTTPSHEPIVSPIVQEETLSDGFAVRPSTHPLSVEDAKSQTVVDNKTAAATSASILPDDYAYGRPNASSSPRGSGDGGDDESKFYVYGAGIGPADCVDPNHSSSMWPYCDLRKAEYN
mmetsp:Transcript_7041/g.13778  ORF Transcript_7041/g.13778 Transcript_7041/m.13778 type:complete len:246 (-) Transcript_7041:1392-2129(-)